MFNCTAGRLCFLHLYSNAVRKHNTTPSCLRGRCQRRRLAGRPPHWPEGPATVAPFYFIFDVRQAKPPRRRLCDAEIRSSIASGIVPSTAFYTARLGPSARLGCLLFSLLRLPSDSAFLGCLLQLS